MKHHPYILVGSLLTLLVGCDDPLSRKDRILIDEQSLKLTTISPLSDADATVGEPVTLKEAIEEYALPTTDGPNEPMRALSLRELRSSVLENNLSLRLQMLDPAIAATNVLAERAKLDSTFTASATQQDYLNYNIYSSNVEFKPSTSNDFDISLEVPMVTGGTVTIGNDLEFSDNGFNPPYWSSAASIYYEQPLLQGAGRIATEGPIIIAEIQQRAALAQAKVKVIAMLSKAETVYWQLYNAWRNFEIQQEVYALAREHVTMARNLAKGGVIPESEVLMTQITQVNQERYVLEAHHEVVNNGSLLINFMNNPNWPIESTTLPVPGSEPVMSYLQLDVAALSDWAAKNRAETLAAELTMAADSLAVEVTQHALLPQLSAWGEYQRIGVAEGSMRQSLRREVSNSYLFYGEIGDLPTAWSVGLNYQMMLGNYEAEASFRRSVLERLSSATSRESVMQSIRTQVRIAADGSHTAWNALLTAHLQLQLAKRQLEDQQKRFKGGVLTAINLEYSLETFRDAELTYAYQVSQYQISRIELATAAGTLLGHANVEWGETAIDSLNGNMPNNLGQDLEPGVFSPEDIRNIYPEPYQAPPVNRDE